MDPKVFTASGSSLKQFFLAMRLAVRVRHTVAGPSKPSGTLATMMPMRKMTASNQVYSRVERMKKALGSHRSDVDKMFNFRSDGSLAPFQPRSQGGSAHHGSIPVYTTMPRAVPSTQLVEKAMFRVSRGFSW